MPGFLPSSGIEAPPLQALAETVDMWTDWQRLQSTNLKTTRYEPDLQELEIQFQSGNSYRYRGVPSSTYQNLCTAPSPGKFFNAEIKDQYPEG